MKSSRMRAKTNNAKTATKLLVAMTGKRDDEPAASPDAPRTRHRGSYKGSSARVRDTKKPDPSVDRAEEGEFGTAYRIPGESSHASHPRSRSSKKRRMSRIHKGSNKGSWSAAAHAKAGDGA